MKVMARPIVRWGIITLLAGVVLFLAANALWADWQRTNAAQQQALAHTRVFTQDQPDMAIQVHDVPGQPSIGALDPFTNVSVQCIVTVNGRQYARVTVDPSSAFFPERQLYVRAGDVEHHAGAPVCG